MNDFDPSVMDIDHGYTLNWSGKSPSGGEAGAGDGSAPAFKIPRIAYGTFELSGEEAETCVISAVEMGYRLIDCARFYGNEKQVGKALAEVQTSVPREQLFVQSKVWNDRQIDGTVRGSLEETLRDLQLDYLDIFIVHWPVEGHYLDTYEQILGFIDEGLVRFAGVSNFQVGHLQSLVDRGYPLPAIDQMEHHPRMQDNDTLGFCRENGIVYEAWSPLGRGGSLSSVDPVIAQISNDHGITPAQTILAWQEAEGIIPLPRSKNPEHMLANAASLAVELSSDEMAKMESLNRHEYLEPAVQPSNFGDVLNGLSSHFD